MQNYSIHIQYNENNSVKVSFDKVTEWYIVNHFLLKDRYLKYQSRFYTSSLIKKKLLLLKE